MDTFRAHEKGTFYTSKLTGKNLCCFKVKDRKNVFF